MNKRRTNKESGRKGQPKPKPRTAEPSGNLTKNSKNLKKLNKLTEKKRILKTQMLALDVMQTYITGYRQTQINLENQIEASMAESVLQFLRNIRVSKRLSLDFATEKAESEEYYC